MPSHATACRKPIQCTSVARVPIATAGSTPRPVNSLSVARQSTSTVQHARPSAIASMASSFAAMSVSSPANQAIVSPNAPKPTSSLPRVAARCSKLASDRIQARRQRVTANLDVAKKRPTAPTSIRQTSSMPSRAPPPPPAVIAPASSCQLSSMPSRVPSSSPAVTTPVSILKSPLKPSRVIPPPSVYAPASTIVSSWKQYGYREPRGRMPYCEGRPRIADKNGNRLVLDYQPQSFGGIKCTCHTEGGIIPTESWIDPRQWKTTPAEADVTPGRRRIVRFANNPVRSTRRFKPWYNTFWPPPEKSDDDATEKDDDAAIRAMDNPPAIEAITKPLPSSSDFESTWQALMDEGFPDDED
ncbi:MAG: hypothetical protein ALECFALPRED_006284 [Alectoria fallacina]|uniref:Uncharacterized protein n=1 Tax=Alectoria fallacina TaxID=1903189 RepID=A0A8H3ERJ3_9LECA|nr:MAG: hypothetical protein ALECFALPRED_006284 [Alectoria fallacina]